MRKLPLSVASAALLMIVWVFPSPTLAEDKWEFSISAFGGKSYPSNEDLDITCHACTPSFHGTAHRVNLNDSSSWGGKLTTWYLPRRLSWQPQVGFELDWTRFTPDLHPQRTSGTGTLNVPGFEIGGFTFTDPQDFDVNVVALNLLFRYPIWATPEMPQGRWHPYVGGGLGVQRAHTTFMDFQQTDYSPAVQGLAGLKFFFTRNIAIFGEFKRTSASHGFTYGSLAPPGYKEQWTIASNHLVAGLALHF